MNVIIPNLAYHLEWRKTNIPRPRFVDSTLNLLNSGILYLHGRCKDNSAIMVLDFIKLGAMIKSKEIDGHKFCGLQNHFARYIESNMTVPG